MEEILDIQPPEGVKEMDRLETAESVYDQIPMPECHSHIAGMYRQVGSMIHILLYK